jgi:predicted GNAT family acetyltransferase/predicted nucleic acid-binding protein
MPNSTLEENTSSKTKFSVNTDSSLDDQLEAAISLWKKNRSTLGMFPRGAFEDHANKNWIVYLRDDNSVKGYLLYRNARNRVVISHLCVSDEIRGQGGARVLFNALKDTVDDGHCRGIEVRCRSDYQISRMWPSLGFECIRNIAGRAKDGSELTIWFYKFDVSDFFYDMMPKQDDDDLTWAILDSNIVFKLSTPDAVDSEESLSLVSDTISSYVRYFVTPEVFVETERKKSQKEKEKSNKFARKFEKIEVKRSAFEKYRDVLAPIWGSITSDRDRSDLNHIAYAAASGFQNFITQDEGLLNKSESIYDICNISVLRPVDFVTQLDQIENLEKYTPRSLSRTKYLVCCPSFEEIVSVADSFCLPNQGEKRKILEAKIRSAVANPEQYKTILVSNSDGNHVAFLCFKNLGRKRPRFRTSPADLI